MRIDGCFRPVRCSGARLIGFKVERPVISCTVHEVVIAIEPGEKIAARAEPLLRMCSRSNIDPKDIRHLWHSLRLGFASTCGASFSRGPEYSEKRVPR